MTTSIRHAPAGSTMRPSATSPTWDFPYSFSAGVHGSPVFPAFRWWAEAIGNAEINRTCPRTTPATSGGPAKANCRPVLRPAICGSPSGRSRAIPLRTEDGPKSGRCAEGRSPARGLHGDWLIHRCVSRLAATIACSASVSACSCASRKPRLRHSLRRYAPQR